MSSRRGKMPLSSNDYQPLSPSPPEGADFLHFIDSFNDLTTVENYSSTHQAPNTQILSETDQYPPPYISPSEWSNFPNINDLTTVENYSSTHQAPNTQTLSETDQYPPPYFSPSEWSNFPNINDPPLPEIQPIDSFTTVEVQEGTSNKNWGRKKKRKGRQPQQGTSNIVEETVGANNSTDLQIWNNPDTDYMVAPTDHHNFQRYYTDQSDFNIPQELSDNTGLFSYQGWLSDWNDYTNNNNDNCDDNDQD
ncbi:hypothetical protein OROMI_033252 [Orobanche minor]